MIYAMDMVMRNISQAKAGKPFARLVAYSGPASPRTPGAMAGEIWIAPDFDSLPQDVAEAFGMTEPQR